MTSNMNGFYEIFDDTRQTYIGIAQIDSNLNVNWVKYIGGEGFNIAWNTLPTSDSGIVVVGTYYDSLLVDNLDPIMFKIAPDGTFNNINETDNLKIYNYLLYPNPGCAAQAGPQAVDLSLNATTWYLVSIFDGGPRSCSPGNRAS